VNDPNGHSKITANGTIQWAIYHFLLLVCSKNVSILHHYRDITTFAVYMTNGDLKKSFSFNMIVEIQGHVHFLILV